MSPMDDSAMPVDPAMLASEEASVAVPPPVEAPEEMGEEEEVEDSSDVRSPDSMSFEDFFPPLDLSEKNKEHLRRWFDRDLLACVRHNQRQQDEWAKYRLMYLLDYVEMFYPSSGAHFASGLLCERTLEAMDRLRRAIFTPRPLFVVDTEMSSKMKPETLWRLEWVLHTMLIRETKVQETLGMGALFEYVMDGSLIVEADNTVEMIPQRTMKTVMSLMELEGVADKALDARQVQDAEALVAQGKPAKILIEQDVVTKEGLSYFIVDKQDHLVPPNVTNESDLRFRARRMYMTEADLRLLASEGVNWYSKKDVDQVVRSRNDQRTATLAAQSDPKAEQVNPATTESSILFHPWWQDQDSLAPDQSTLPWKNTWNVYRITCKYGYRTKGDPSALIPKWCVFDYEPESKTILRARVYPHFHEQKNWFHFKLGYAPGSYWGFGFGKRLSNDDQLESNGVNLFMDTSAMATYNPFLCVHPDHGGMIPFGGGFGPAKIGYVRQITDFKPLEIPAPSEGLLRMLLPLIQRRADNRTSVTAYSQGHVESSDPRSPAAKTQMLLAEASLGIESMILDWNTKGWEPLAAYTWAVMKELSVYQHGSNLWGGLVLWDEPKESDEEEAPQNYVTFEELQELDVTWKSQAASTYLNTELRKQAFLENYAFFAPILQGLAQINPEMYKKYFIRWMQRAGRELDIHRAEELIPSEEEMKGMSTEALQGMQESLLQSLRAGQTPGQINVQGGGAQNPVLPGGEG